MDTNRLICVGAGSGIEKMREKVDDSEVQFGLLKLELGEGQLRRARNIFVHINGERCPNVKRGKCNECKAEAMSILRGEQGFSASLEIGTQQLVTTEHIMSEVAQFFVVDESAAYDVQRTMKSTEHLPGLEVDRFSAAPQHQIACYPGQHSEHTFTSGRDALKAVREDPGRWRWMLMGDEGSPVYAGLQAVDEMRTCMVSHQNEVLFGALRMSFGVGRLRRTKWVFVHFVGPSVPAFQRGKAASNRQNIEKLIAKELSWSVAMEVDTPEDFTEVNVVNQVRRAAEVDDEEVAQDQAMINVFTVQHFREALEVEMGMHIREDMSEQQESRSIGGKTVEEVVTLVCTSDAPWSWALFIPNTKSSQKSSAMPVLPTSSRATKLPHVVSSRHSTGTSTGSRPAATPLRLDASLINSKDTQDTDASSSADTTSKGIRFADASLANKVATIRDELCLDSNLKMHEALKEACLQIGVSPKQNIMETADFLLSLVAM